MLCQMGADGATSDKLTLDREHVKPLDVFLIKDPGQHTHTLTHTSGVRKCVCVCFTYEKLGRLFVKVAIALPSLSGKSRIYVSI